MKSKIIEDEDQGSMEFDDMNFDDGNLAGEKLLTEQEEELDDMLLDEGNIMMDDHDLDDMTPRDDFDDEEGL